MKRSLRYLVMIGKLSIYSFTLSMIFLNPLLANSGEAQGVESIKETTISVKIFNKSLEDALKMIEEKTNYNFIYNKGELKDKGPISVSVSNQTVETLLLQISNQAQVSFRQVNDRISVRTSEPGNTVGQVEVVMRKVDVKGVVMGDDGETLPGATVVEKGTSNGTVTDSEGKFSLKVEEDATLSVSFVGYQTSEVTLGSQTEITVTLKSDLTSLDEVVVIGYGEMEKKDVTGAISSVKGDELRAFPASRSDQLLQGRAAGVQIINTNSDPGGSVSIRIRGTSSINSSSDPLVIVDGVIGVDFATISPNDIESMEVLKDASATAIYGSRGANGVILITTKRGKEGKVNVVYTGSLSAQTMREKPDLMNASQHAEYINAAIDGGQLDETLRQQENLGEGTDWIDQVFRTAPMTNHNVFISGGSETTTVGMSLDYFGQDGIIKGSDYERASVRINLDQKVSDRFKVGTNIYFARSGQNSLKLNSPGGGNSGVSALAVEFSPIVPPYDENGNYSPSIDPATQQNNPLALVNERIDYGTRGYLQGSIFGDLELVQGLNLRSSFSYTYQSVLNRFWAGSDLVESNNGNAQVNNTTSDSWLSETTLTYKKILAERHELTVLGGFTAQRDKSFNGFLGGQDFPTETNTYNQIELSDPLNFNIGSGNSERSLLSYIGRIHYSFADKYFFTASGRYDGSSVFAEGNKYSFFPSFAVKWNLTQEPAFNALASFADISIRGSWGEVGNQGISPYGTFASSTVLPVYVPGLGEQRFAPDGFTPITSVVLDQLANPDLSWETTRQVDVGLDAHLFDSKLTLTFDYYKKNTIDLLFSRQLPRISGVTSIIDNIGEVENSGFEIALGFINDFGDLNWRANANMSINKNKVIDLGDVTELSLNPSYIKARAGSARLIEGQPLGVFYGYVFDGIYQNQEEIDALPFAGAIPGDARFRDLNGDNVVDVEDQQIIGHPLAEYYFSFDNTFTYKGFDLNVFLIGSVGNDIANLTYANERATANKSVDFYNNYWRGEGTSNSRPMPERQVAFSSYFIEDGSYVRIKNIALGYNFSRDLLDRWGWISGLRVYVSGQNLFTFTEYSGFDPEVNSKTNSNTLLGWDQGAFPMGKVYTVGVRASF